jgi:hypothetical protein
MMVLSAEAVATIRMALVTALQFHGGDLEAEDELGLPDQVRELEQQARAALAVLAEA